MMLKTTDILIKSDIIKKTNKQPINRKIWPIPGSQDQEEWSRDLSLQQMINRPAPPKSRSFLPANGFGDNQQTVDNNVG